MKYLKAMLRDKSFLRKTMAITVPIALQNMLNSVLNLVDTLMIGKLGETTISAVGLANKVFYVFALLLFGICSGSVVLASQYWGKKELLNIRRVLRIALYVGIGGSLIFAFPAMFFPEIVMRIFTPEKDVIAIGAVYLVIIAFSYPLTAVSNVYAVILRSMNYVKLPVFVTSFAIVVNIVLNYLLIYGKFGFPEMGVAGAALATVIARLAEFGLMLFLIHRHKAGDDGLGDFVHAKYEKAKENGVRFINKEFFSKFIHTASPVIANEFMWGLGVTMYSLVYGRMGNQAVASITISNNVEQVALVFFFGICSAAAVILGNELGANEFDKAEEDAKKFLVLQLCLSVLGAIVIILIRYPVISMFNVSDTVAGYIGKCLLVFALMTPIKMLNTLFIVAIFRSGGDTKAALFLDVSGVWLIGIPMAVLGGLVFKFPIYIVYAMVLIEEVYKCSLSYIRYRQKKWVRNIVSTEL